MKRFSYTEEEAIKKLLLWQSVAKVNDNTLLLSNGTKLHIHPNKGCGGCNNGWFDITVLNEVPNAITAVEFVNEPTGEDEWSEAETFKIFVYSANQKIELLSVDGEDNGYYGVGYWIEVEHGD